MLEAILEPIDIERKLFVSYLDTGVARHQVSFSDFLSLFPDTIAATSIGVLQIM